MTVAPPQQQRFYTRLQRLAQVCKLWFQGAWCGQALWLHRVLCCDVTLANLVYWDLQQDGVFLFETVAQVGVGITSWMAALNSNFTYIPAYGYRGLRS